MSNRESCTVTRGKTCAELGHADSPSVETIESALRTATLELEIATSAVELATAKVAANVRALRDLREQA